MSLFKPQFDKYLDKATSYQILEPDWPSIIKICDLIRQGDVQPKYALAQIKKKLNHANPRVALFSFQVLESCVKNCGSLIHEEIATKAYMEQLRDLAKTTQHIHVRTKILELLQAWAYAFRNTQKYRVVQDTVNIMRTEGYKFPVMKESDAMFSADTAPEWTDGLCCHRCRVQFSLIQRRHHCRACGQIFCGQCTSKTCILPRFGIEKEVRVCDTCHENHSKSMSSTPPSSSSNVARDGVKTEELPTEYLSSPLSQQSQGPPQRKCEEELREEEELQLALALSQSEAEVKNCGHKSVRTSSPVSGSNRTKTYSPPPQLSCSPEDPELAKYLNRSHWEKQSQNDASNRSTPSAPLYQPTSNLPINKDNEVNERKICEEIEDFVYKLGCQIEIFVNRMKSNSSRGRSVANDSSVQTMFVAISTMHSQLLQYVNKQDDDRVYYEGLQDKLTQVRDARAALDALREEHREQMRREAEAAERQRQIQMQHKLEMMRKKKQEYLQYQRQLAIQRIQDQEREMQLRLEQQKQLNMRSTTQQPSSHPHNTNSAPYPPNTPYYQPPPGYDGVNVGLGIPPQFPPPQGVYQQPPPFHGAAMMGHEFMVCGPGSNMEQMPSGRMMSPPGLPPNQVPQSSQPQQLNMGHPQSMGQPSSMAPPPSMGQNQQQGMVPPGTPVGHLPVHMGMGAGVMPPHVGPSGTHMPGMVPPQIQPSPNHSHTQFYPSNQAPPENKEAEPATGELISFD